MKVKKLDIQTFKHLHNLKFDFTYPIGHPKEGQVLEKICFIGQSATGKTNILELIYNSCLSICKTELLNDESIFSNYQWGFDGDIEVNSKEDSIHQTKNKIIKNGKEYSTILSGGGSISNLVNEKTNLIYFTSDLISKQSISIFNQSPVDILENDVYKAVKAPTLFDKIQFNYKFDNETDPGIWFSLLLKILDYRKKFTQLASELINKGLIGDFDKMNKEYKKWESKNENPLVLFATYFNPILEKLNLEVDLVNTEYPVPIKSKINDDVIPVSHLSTGTKGLLLSMFPLFQLETNDSMIFIDEPERSLYPDLQVDLMSYYKAIAPNAKLIVATHSPFIAASFEPEERFILYFDKHGKVAVKPGKSPIGDDPNDMLSNDFNVNYYNEHGKQAYKEYVNLKRKMAQEKEPAKKKDLLLELSNLGDKYNF